MAGTLGPAKSWRVVYTDDLIVSFFKETDGMLYTGQNCFECNTEEECIAEMKRLKLKTFGPDKSWRVIYDPSKLIVYSFEEKTGFTLVSSAYCFECATKQECLDKMKELNLQYGSWKSWIYSDNTCTAPIRLNSYTPDLFVDIGIESEEYGYFICETYDECMQLIAEKGYRIK